MENLLKPEAWPIWCCIGVTFALAVVNTRTLRMPNVPVFGFLLGGLLLGAAHSLSIPLADNGGGGILAALVGAGVAFALLLVMWLIGGIGAGSVKLQMAIGSWLGAYYGMGLGLTAVIWATVLAIVWLIVFGGAVMLKQRYRKPSREILREMPTGLPQWLGLVSCVAGLELRVLPVLGS